MVEDDLSQRLWRQGARDEVNYHRIIDNIFREVNPDSIKIVLLREEIERLKETAALKSKIFAAQVAETRKLQDVLGHFSLHTADDAFVIRKMGSEERELYADAVDAWSARLHAGEDEPAGHFPRWWRDDYVGPLPR